MATTHSLISWASKVLISLALLTSCHKHSDEPKENRTFLVELKDAFIVNTVRRYIGDTHLDSTKAILSVNVKTTSYDTSVYIRHFEQRSFKSPTRYSLIDGFLVFIYTDVDRFIDNSLVSDEIESVILQRDIDLDTTLFIDDTPTLKISKCEGGILHEIEADEIELPCFLEIIEENGELKLVKKE